VASLKVVLSKEELKFTGGVFANANEQALRHFGKFTRAITNSIITKRASSAFHNS
jgi:hypothetical protein